MTSKNYYNDKVMVEQFIKEYGYNPEDIETNFQFRDENVNIAIFYHGKPHIISNSWLIGLINETNQDLSIKKIKNLFINFTNLKFGIWSSKEQILYFKNDNGNIKRIFNIPLQGKTLDFPKRLELKILYDLERKFEIIHNHIYANEGYSTTEAYNEILKLLFLKIYDERYPVGENVRFGISEKEYKQIIAGKENGFKKRCDALFDETKKEFKEIFDEYEIIKLKENTLAFIVGQLQNYNLSASERDIKGTAFQKFIFAHQRGSRGQFLTPDPIVRLIVNIIKPKSSDKILDPACGTGRFLDESLKYIRENEFSKIEDIERRSIKEKEFIKQNLRGIDISPTITRTAIMRFILDDADNIGLITSNSLSDWKEIKDNADKMHIEGSILKSDYDILMTNPPFGTQGRINDKTILKNYSLGHKWKINKNKFILTEKLERSQVPEILFIERCLDFLKENGRLGIVIPQSIAQNITLGYLRDYIFEKAKILSVISLPPETFIPFGTGIKVTIFILQKKSTTELKKEIENDYKIFFSIIENVGYEGKKNATPIYLKNEVGELIKRDNGDFIIQEDISIVISKYNKFLKNQLFEENNKVFIRNFSELRNRLDPEFYKPKFKHLKEHLIKSGAVPLSSVVKIINKKSEILKIKDLNVKYIEIGNINSEFSEIFSHSEMKVHELPSRASYEIKKGDIVTAVSGISTGTPKHASAYVTEEYDGCICTNGLRVLRPFNIDPFYLLAYLKTDIFLSQILQLRTGSAIPAVNDNDFKDVMILLPNENLKLKIVEKMKNNIELRKKAKIEIIDAIKLLEFQIEVKKIEENFKGMKKHKTDKTLTNWI